MISTITVNYKSVDYLERMLKSLFLFHSQEEIEVIVVENASGDDLTLLKTQFPQVLFLFSEKNLGFAGGCNLALRQAGGEYLVLLNPDILFVSPALYQIRDAMNDLPDVGIGGVSLKNMDESVQKCVWRFPTPLDQFVLLLKLPHVFPHIGPIVKWRMDDFDYTQNTDVDQVMGAFFCIRKSVTEQIGFMDDGFFLWYEEVDYCRRTKNAGWRIRYFADISVLHKKAGSFDRVGTLEKQNVLRQSVRRYLRKHFGVTVWIGFCILEPLFSLLSRLAAWRKPM